MLGADQVKDPWCRQSTGKQDWGSACLSHTHTHTHANSNKNDNNYKNNNNDKNNNNNNNNNDNNNNNNNHICHSKKYKPLLLSLSIRLL